MRAKLLHQLLVLAGLAVLFAAITVSLEWRAAKAKREPPSTGGAAATPPAGRPLPDPVGEIPDEAEIARRGKDAREKGKELGKGRTAKECVAEGMRRVQECDGVVCNVIEQFFTEGCLSKVAADPAFCEGVPARTKGGTWSGWSLSRCARENVDPRRGCPRVLAALQDFCNGGPPR